MTKVGCGVVGGGGLEGGAVGSVGVERQSLGVDEQDPAAKICAGMWRLGRQLSGQARSHQVCCGTEKTAQSVMCLLCKNMNQSVISASHMLRKAGCDGMCLCACNPSSGGVGRDRWESGTHWTAGLASSAGSTPVRDPVSIKPRWAESEEIQ